MYWYYFQAARGIQVWWKQWITRLQITQFIIDLCKLPQIHVSVLQLTRPLVAVYFASYTYFTSTYFPDFPNYGSCAGEEFAAFAGCGILSSYLFLFLSFYAATYKRSGKRAARKSISNGTIAIDPKFNDEAVAAIRNGKGASNGASKTRKA
jgi:fatty acid elongase 3